MQPGEKKKVLIQEFTKHNITSLAYPARLSTADSVGLHFDKGVPAHAKCMDIWAEVYLMSRCRSLLATWSNIAGLVASFSTALPWYFVDFWGHEFELGTSGSSSGAPGVTAAASATTGDDDDDVRFFWDGPDRVIVVGFSDKHSLWSHALELLQNAQHFSSSVAKEVKHSYCKHGARTI